MELAESAKKNVGFKSWRTNEKNPRRLESLFQPLLFEPKFPKIYLQVQVLKSSEEAKTGSFFWIKGIPSHCSTHFFSLANGTVAMGYVLRVNNFTMVFVYKYFAFMAHTSHRMAEKERVKFITFCRKRYFDS